MYLIVALKKSGKIEHTLSKSRNAMMHLEIEDAKSVELYDRNGWLLSRAERDEKGNPTRPKLFLDGEPKKYYKDMYKELLCM